MIIDGKYVYYLKRFYAGSLEIVQSVFQFKANKNLAVIILVYNNNSS